MNQRLRETGKIDSMTKEELIAQIEAAFDGVVLGEGVGLNEATGMDDYILGDELEKLRAGDEKQDWRKISAESLDHNPTSLSFFDAEGMRFHLPAFLKDEIVRQVGENQVIFHLTALDDYMKGNYKALVSTQRKAVVAFLEWCMPQEEYERPEILIALSSYWDAN